MYLERGCLNSKFWEKKFMHKEEKGENFS